MSRIISYTRQGETIHLEESNSHFVIRTVDGFSPHEILAYSLQGMNSEFHNEMDSFPEASVWVFKLNEHSSLSIAELKTAVVSNKHPKMIFIGSVWVDSETKRYQLYTENLFIKFKPTLSTEECYRLLEQWGIDVKIKLEFSPNTFFVEPRDSKIIDTFSWTELLNQKTEVETCEPELIVKRKSAERSQTKHILDPDRKWANNAIGLDKAWEATKGKGINICIIDDGIDPEHPAFNQPGKILDAKDVLKGDENRSASHLFASEFHGTACASIASSGDYRSYGIAPDSQLIIVRSKGLGSILDSEAIHWGVTYGADIV